MTRVRRNSGTWSQAEEGFISNPRAWLGDSVKMELPYGIQPFNAPHIFEEPVRAAIDGYIGLRFCVASGKLRLLDYMAKEFWPHEVIPSGPDST